MPKWKEADKRMDRLIFTDATDTQGFNQEFDDIMAMVEEGETQVSEDLKRALERHPKLVKMTREEFEAYLDADWSMSFPPRHALNPSVDDEETYESPSPSPSSLKKPFDNEETYQSPSLPRPPSAVDLKNSVDDEETYQSLLPQTAPKKNLPSDSEDDLLDDEEIPGSVTDEDHANYLWQPTGSVPRRQRLDAEARNSDKWVKDRLDAVEANLPSLGSASVDSPTRRLKKVYDKRVREVKLEIIERDTSEALFDARRDFVAAKRRLEMCIEDRKAYKKLKDQQ